MWAIDVKLTVVYLNSPRFCEEINGDNKCLVRCLQELSYSFFLFYSRTSVSSLLFAISVVGVSKYWTQAVIPWVVLVLCSLLSQCAVSSWLVGMGRRFFKERYLKRSPSRVLHCDKSRRAFENTSVMWKTYVAGECFAHLFSALQCLECFITV